MKQWQDVFMKKLYQRALGIMFALLVLCAATGGLNVSQAGQRQTLDRFGYVETVYDNSNGLDSSAANDVVQTPDGFIWIGTYNGLTRYDGSSFYQFPMIAVGAKSHHERFDGKVKITTCDENI